MIELIFFIFLIFFIIVLFVGFRLTRTVEGYKNKDDYVIYELNDDYEFDYNGDKVSLILVDGDNLLGYKSKLLKNWKLRKVKTNYQFYNGKDVYYIKVNNDDDYPVRIMYKDYEFYINILKTGKKGDIISYKLKFNKNDIGEIEETKKGDITTKVRIRTKDNKLKQNVKLLTAIFSGFLINEALMKKRDYDNEPELSDKRFDDIK